MNDLLRSAIFSLMEKSRFAETLGIELVSLDDGLARLQMYYKDETMNNLFGKIHGGVIFTLIDEAFAAASQTTGYITIGMNVSVSYIRSPDFNSKLCAEAVLKDRTRKTLIFDIKVTENYENIVAVCQATAYNTGKMVL